MNVKLLQGFHITAFDKKVIVELVKANLLNSENVFAKTTKKRYKIISLIEDNTYQIKIWANETDDWGRSFVRDQTVIVNVK